MPRDPDISAGLLAEFDSADALLDAARRVTAAGYTRTDAFTPFPLEELPDALNAPHPKMALFTLIGATVGGLTGFGMCWYANVLSYPLNIGGRPHNSWPAWIPLTFELAVLFAVLTGTLAMFISNGLPRLHHPLFDSPGFDRATSDRFFLAIDAEDPRFHVDTTAQLLRDIGATAVTRVPLEAEVAL